MKRLIVSLIGVGLFVGTLWLGWSFRAGNAVPVDLDLIWIQVPAIELWWVIMVSIALGVVTATILLGFAWLRVRLLNARYRRAIRRLESELHEMRSLPLTDAEPAMTAAAAESR